MSKKVIMALPILVAFAFLLIPATSISKPGDAPPTVNVNVVNDAVRLPFRQTKSVDFSGAEYLNIHLLEPSDFPGDDYLFVAEAISYKAHVPAGQKVKVRVGFPAAGGASGLSPAYFNFPQAVPWSNGGWDSIADSMSLRGYSTDSGDVIANVNRNSNSNDLSSMEVSIFGYFVPIDSPSVSP